MSKNDSQYIYGCTLAWSLSARSSFIMKYNTDVRCTRDAVAQIGQSLFEVVFEIRFSTYFRRCFFFFKIRILWNLVFLQADIPNTSLWCGGGAWSWRMWAQTILIASCLITNPGNSVNTENTNKGAFLPLNKYCFW